MVPQPARSRTAAHLLNLAVIVAVISIGAAHHHGTALIDRPTVLPLVLAPFVGGWGAAAVGERALVTRTRDVSRRIDRSRVAVAATAVGRWTAIVAIAATLRATALFPGDAPLTFVAVVWGTGLPPLVGVRLVDGWLRSGDETDRRQR